MGCALCGAAPGSSGEAVRLHDSFSGFCGKCGRPGVLSIDLRGTQITDGLAAFAADGRLATGSQDDAAKIWSANGATCMATLEGHRNSVASVAFTADGRITTGSDDRTAKIWSAGGAACLTTLEGLRDSVTSGAFAADGRLATGSQDNTAKLWSANGATCLATEQDGGTPASARLAACVAACVAACRAPVLPARPDGVQQRPVPGHEHRLWLSGGITWCQVCGAYGEARLRGLLRPCPGPLRGRGGRSTTLQRLRAGRHPLTLELLPSAKPLR